MPEVRSVSVHLDADVAGYIAKMRLAGAETDKAFSSGARNIGSTNTALKGTETELGKVDAAARRASTSVSDLDKKYQSGARSQDRFTGGTRILISTIAALGPAAVPIAAVAVPAVAGLTAELGSAVIGVGVAELAFHGLGKALTAFNKAELNPTTANIAAAQAALDALPASAQKLVLELHSLGPELDKLRQSAASGLAPGVTAGLKSLVTDAPVVDRAVHGVATELGSLVQQAGRALAGPEWRGFIRTVGVQTPIALHQMGVATGDVVHGLAQLYLAFGPSLGSFDDGVVKVAKDFDRWATSLGQSQGFEDFLNYLSVNGPRVLSLLGDTADLLVSIVRAAAPLGGPTLQALDGIAKVLDLIAKSPLGTPIILLLQLSGILRLTNNLLGVMGVNAKIGFSGIAAGATKTKGELSGVRAEAAAAGAALRTMYQNVRGGIALRDIRGAGIPIAPEGKAALGKGALLAGGVALLSSGLPSKLGLSNTATLALAGSLGGPLVAGAGAAVGALIDVSHATDALAAATHNVQQSIGSLDFAREASNLKTLREQLDTYQSHADAISHNGIFGGLLHPIADAQYITSRINNLFSHNNQQAQSAYASGSAAFDQQRVALSQVLEGIQGSPLKAFPSNNQLQALLTRIQPALSAMNISTSQLIATAQKGGPAFDNLVGQINNYLSAADGTKGQTAAVAAAFANMSNQATTAADKAKALSSSLDALVDPMLNLGSAADTFQKDLNDLPQNLSTATKSLRGNSDAVIQNRTVIRGAIGDLKSKIEAEANAGESSKRMSATLRSGVGALLAQGQAAGLNRAQIQHMIDTMHLTPKLIKTLIQADPNPALDATKAVIRALAAIPRTIPVHINVTRSTNANLAEQGALTNPKGRAGGGAVYGPGTSTSDSILARLSNGEFVMRAAAVQKYGLHMMQAMNVGAYAGGGLVQNPAAVDVYIADGLGAAAGSAAGGLHALRQSANALNKELSQEQQRLQSLQQARQSLASAVRANFLPQQLFGATAAGSGIWSAGGGLLDPLHTVNMGIRDARTYTRDLTRLHNRGLRGAALAQVQTLAEAQQALTYSPRYDRELTNRYQILERAARAAGQEAGVYRYGRQLAEANRRLDQLHHDLHDVEAAIKHHEKEAKQHAKDNAAAVTKGVNGAVHNGVTRQKPWG